jgi:hypothetical protein
LGVVCLVDEKHTFAFKGEQRYFAFQRASDHQEDFAPEVESLFEATNKPVSPKRNSSRSFQTAKHCEYAFNNRVRQIRSHDTGSLNVVSKEQVSGSDLACFDQTYLHAQCRELPDVFDKADLRASWRLPDALDDDDVHVRPTREDVDGHACAVVELRMKNRVFWCDPELGYAVRRWEGRTRDTNLLCNRYHLQDYREVAPSIWLPFLIVQEACAPKAPQEYRNRPIMTYTLRVERLEANDVPDALFTLEAPAGTRVADRTIAGQDKPVMYKVPADPSKLDATIAAVLARRSETLISPPGRKWVLFFVGVNIAALLVLVALLVFRRRQRRLREKMLLLLTGILFCHPDAHGADARGADGTAAKKTTAIARMRETDASPGLPSRRALRNAPRESGDNRTGRAPGVHFPIPRVSSGDGAGAVSDE